MDLIGRKKQQILDYERQLASLMRGRVTPPPQAHKLITRIAALKAELSAIEQDQRQTLAEALPRDEAYRNRVYYQMVKLPVVADFLYDCCVALNEVLKEQGINELTITTKVNAVRDGAKDLAFMLSRIAPLEAILSADDTLIDALHKKTDNFLRQRMNIIHDETH